MDHGRAASSCDHRAGAVRVIAPMGRTERTARVFTPMVGTAFLARATDDRAGGLSPRAESGPSAYSARDLVAEYLVPDSVSHGFSLRTTERSLDPS